MMAIATKKQLNEVSRGHLLKKQIPISSMRDIPLYSYSDTGVQRKPTCPCGGGCPRCRDNSSIQTKQLLKDHSQQTELHMPCLQRQYSPSIFPRGTNYRFDTFQITESDLSDPEVTARLQGLSKDQLRHYLERVTDQAVRDYILNLFAAPKQQAPPPPPQKPAPPALDCDKKPLVESWGQDTCCSRKGFTDDEAVNKKTGEKMSSCNKWPLFLALHAKEHGLEGVASCKPSKLGQKAQIKAGGNILTVGCIDTRANENNVIEIDAEAAGVFFGSKQLSEHADEVCYGGSFDSCEFSTTCREFPKETWCLPIGVTKAETTDSPTKHGWAKR